MTLTEEARSVEVVLSSRHEVWRPVLRGVGEIDDFGEERVWKHKKMGMVGVVVVVVMMMMMMMMMMMTTMTMTMLMMMMMMMRRRRRRRIFKITKN
jgi:hypothetical protein